MDQRRWDDLEPEDLLEPEEDDFDDDTRKADLETDDLAAELAALGDEFVQEWAGEGE